VNYILDKPIHVISIPSRVGRAQFNTKAILSEKTEIEIGNPATKAPAAKAQNSRVAANLAI
jgi:hypothetical protein